MLMCENLLESKDCDGCEILLFYTTADDDTEQTNSGGSQAGTDLASQFS